MKKSELKTGMVLETKDGRRGIVMLNTSEGDKVVGEDSTRLDQTWSPLSSWNEDLTYKADDNREIVKIYDFGPTNCYGASTKQVGKLLWKKEDRSAWIGKWIVNHEYDEEILIYVTSTREDGWYNGFGITWDDESEESKWFETQSAGHNINASYLRLATAEEIEEGLLREAARRYSTPCRVKYLDSNSIDNLRGLALEFKNGILYASWNNDKWEDIIFKDGEWAES